MRRRLILSSLFFALFLYGLVLSQTHVAIIQESLEPQNATGWYDYRGVTNVHTHLNLGSGTPAEVIDQALEADLDFLFLTDLNVFQRRLDLEGYHRKLLVMVGAEYSYLESRILSYDILKRQNVESIGQAQVQLADLLSQSGSDAAESLLVLAHPFKPGFSWSGAYPAGLDGIEVLNLKSVWQRAWNETKISFLWSLFVYPFNAQLALLRLYSEPDQELQLWDQLNRVRKTIGFAGTEATAKTGPIGQWGWRFPSYQTSFSLISNHVLLRGELTGEPEGDKRKILQALSDGQFYFSLDLFGNPKGFVASVRDGDREYPLGSRVRLRPGIKLVVHLPQEPLVPFETAVMKDGEHIMSSNSQTTEMFIQSPGAYRVVVRVFPVLTLPDGRRWVTWLYTNPIYVVD